ncbi:hypothetical protein [Geodermatophilus amargosae]|uniref:hypothetical protein n=1 Tax=Geodermatophilus amargosae TaxID=1296565 RepID=UPI001114E47F|nr:hypothetical protein [Geodermatophilus amargosae]
MTTVTATNDTLGHLARLYAVPAATPDPTATEPDDDSTDIGAFQGDSASVGEAYYEGLVQEKRLHLRASREAALREAAQDDGAGDSWQELDLGPIYESGIVPPQPTITDRGDGRGLFYPGLPNVIFGDSGAGKTALTQWVAAQELMAGHHVYHVDYETNVYVWLSRFDALGVPRAKVLAGYHYYNLSEGQRPPKTFHPDARIVIIDSLTAAIAASGADPNAMDGVETVYRQVVNPFTRAGLAAVVIDHVPHADKKRMVNSTRKKGIVQGAIYRVEGVRGAPFGPGMAGTSALHLFKDNMGGTQVAVEDVVTTFNMASDTKGLNMQCYFARPSATPPLAQLALQAQRQDELKEKRKQDIYEVVAELADNPPTKTDVYKHIGGTYKYFTEVLNEMITTGQVYTFRPKGARSDHYVIDRP